MEKANYILAHNVRRIRKQLDLTQEKFAELIEVDMKTIVNIENGKHFPKAKTIDQICNKLGIECFELFIDHQKPSSKNEKLLEINVILEKFDEDKLENIYKIIMAFNDNKK